MNANRDDGPGVGLGRRPVDDPNGHRRRCAGAHHGDVCQIRLSRRGGFPGQIAVGEAIWVRRTFGKPDK